MEKKPVFNLEKVKQFFDGELKKHGLTHAATNWGSQASQYRRFEILAETGAIRGKSVLDVGCGLGEFYRYLKTIFKTFDYTGVDISEDMVAGASKLFRGVKFEARDVLKTTGHDKYDFVFASGTFNVKLRGNEKFIRCAIERMYDLSKEAAAVSMLSKYADFFDDFYYYYDPEKIFAFCKTICKRVVLRHDYMPHDFTVVLYKD